jgi:hypothetical protein
MLFRGIGGLDVSELPSENRRIVVFHLISTRSDSAFMRTVAFVLHRLEMVIQIERLERACAGLLGPWMQPPEGMPNIESINTFCRSRQPTKSPMVKVSGEDAMGGCIIMNACCSGSVV